MTSSSDEIDLEARAFLALRGGTFDWQQDLVQYLRSNEPISARFRQSLASALESSTEDGIKLRISGHKKARDGWVGMHSRYEWLQIGQKIAELQVSMGREDALEQVASGRATGTAFGEDKCLAALTYYRRVCRWLSDIEERAAQSGIEPPHSESQLVDLFHFNDFCGKPLDADLPDIGLEVE